MDTPPVDKEPNPAFTEQQPLLPTPPASTGDHQHAREEVADQTSVQRDGHVQPEKELCSIDAAKGANRKKAKHRETGHSDEGNDDNGEDNDGDDEDQV